MKSLRYAQVGPQAMLRMDHWGAVYDVTAPAPFEKKGNVAVVAVGGPGGQPLVEHHHPFWQSYESIADDARAAFESKPSKVLLRINSKGGDAAGCIELARLLRRLSEDSGIPLVALADGFCCSAAYAIASAAQQIVATPTATVGSIGVFEPIFDQTEADRAMGLKITFVSSGKLKLAGNPHVPTSKEAVESVGRQVGELSGLFFDLVSEMRGTARAEVEALEGEAFIGAKALDNSLVDAIEVYADLLARLDSSEGFNNMPAQAKNETKGWDEALKALMDASEGEDGDKARKAKKMLKALMADEKPEDKKAEGEDGDKKDEPAEGKRSEEGKPEDKKAGEEDAEGKKAQAALTSVTERLHALEVERETEKTNKAKAALLDTRKDFSPEVRATLESLPLATIEQAVKNWKRAPGSHAVASMTPPTVIGKDQGDPSANLPDEVQRSIDRAFGRGPVTTFSSLTGTNDRTAAKAYLDNLDKARALNGGK
jgi:ClpP class serine protease